MNNFNWQWWQFFISLTEFGSISKAADSLSISQPTLSRHLIAMEKQLGQSMFDRSTQGLILTSFGESLLEEAGRDPFNDSTACGRHQRCTVDCVDVCSSVA